MKWIYKTYFLAYIVLVFIGSVYFKQYYYIYRNLIAVSWGDGPYGRAMYGVYVYTGDVKDGKVEIKAKGAGLYFVSKEVLKGF